MQLQACTLRSARPSGLPPAPLGARRAGRTGLAVQNLFTGIVQGKATVRAVERKTDFACFDIELPAERADNVAIGASVAINGTCLTVTEQRGPVLRFDVMAETLRRTNLGALVVGTPVNFERSARVGDEIGGHTVSGHVHSTAKIVKVTDTENNRRVEFQLADPAWMKYILPKGFVSVDGCSLTVGEVTPAGFSVYLIPETLRVTVAGMKGEGDEVNIEVETQTQAIVDTVERVLQKYVAEGRLPALPQQ
ncbi:riboflavin synthase subunit alpha [Chlorella sorokiniana]|uniref:Riboflavin synthase subunit alpha n=1 Tax=Chlorella sorokiniana TaxID=3076 RepID=A0A2P6TFV7_CHLSO|nr:riboflavin synthase subunit alpha [Chlorella sorokiniana]|eukprot:PRW32998.1 riboflavin synthase subunit alpha [Chlorella sorokiniana]